MRAQTAKNILPEMSNSDSHPGRAGGSPWGNAAPNRPRMATGQPYQVTALLRSQQGKGNSDRSQKHSTKRRTVPITTWVKGAIRDEIDRIALDGGIHRSSVAATLLEEAVHQKLHIQHAILLGPIIQQAIAEEREKDRKRIAGLLVQNTVLTGQVKYLLTNLLGRSGSAQKVTAEDLYKILDWSKRKARETVIRRGIHTEKLLAAIGEWLDADGREEDELTHA